MESINVHRCKVFRSIGRAIRSDMYKDLGLVEMVEDCSLDAIQFDVVPHEGVHKGIPYRITLKIDNIQNWPKLFVDSAIYDRIKTSQYFTPLQIYTF